MSHYHCSASQINTWRDCPRKWGIEKIDKVRRPPSPYALFGSRVHTLLEAYFLTGAMPPDTAEGRVAQKILVELPRRTTPGIEIESRIEIVINGVDFVGYVDYAILTPGALPFVSDHKTTGDLKWALKPASMHLDPQVAIYCWAAMQQSGSDEIAVQWTYGLRNGRRALPIIRDDNTPITRDQITPVIDRIGDDAAMMRHHYENQTPTETLPYDLDSCGKYGGCPYQHQECRIPAAEYWSPEMSKSKIDEIREKLQARRENLPPDAVAALEALPPVATPAPAPAPKRRGRPPKTAPAAINPPEGAVEAPVAAPAPAPAPKRRGRPPKTAAPAEAPPVAAAAAAAPTLLEILAAGLRGMLEVIEPSSGDGQ